MGAGKGIKNRLKTMTEEKMLLLEPQLVVINDGSMPEEKKLRTIKNNPKSIVSKPHGGLWTSTIKDGDSAWTNWVGSVGRKKNEKAKQYVLSPGIANIYVIDTLDDALKLTREYTMEKPGFQELKESMTKAEQELLMPVLETLDWERIAKDYDAIHLTHQGFLAAKKAASTRNFELSFCAWDCESTLWLKWCFESIKAN